MSNPEAGLSSSNPFATESSLQYRLPPFERIGDADFEPAFIAGMAEQRAEVDAIAHNAEPPSFVNTVLALEHSGRLLARVATVFSNLVASDTNPERQRLDEKLAPQLAAHQDAIHLDEALYARIDALHRQDDSLGLDAESLRLLQRYHGIFTRAGAALSAADKDRLKAINQRLASLMTRFQQNVLAATNAAAVIVSDLAELEGLSTAEIEAAALAAEARGLQGQWLLSLQNTTDQPVLASLDHRPLRERIYRASSKRGNGGSGDNRAVVAALIALRAERAALLGHPHHADQVLADETAQTSAAVNAMIAELTPAALANFKREAASLQDCIDQDAAASGHEPVTLQHWDWVYYAERLRASRYAYSEREVRPYFALQRVLEDGVFHSAQQLFGLRFKPRDDLPAYHPDVRVFEVFDVDDSPLGLFMADFYARESKQGGAWMSSFVDQSALFDTRAVVVINLNIAKPAPGQPALLSFDEVTTLFHEFGHALHGLLSSVRYPLLSGTNVPRDFVEYPSQYNEMWGAEPAVISHYSHHHETGEPLPQALLEKILRARDFNQGFATCEYLAAAIIDQALHQLAAGATPDASALMDFEAAALRDHGIDPAQVPPRYHTLYFSHVFAGGYAAGYYAYVWAEVLAADTEQWMCAHGGLQRASGERLRRTVLSRGNAEEPLAQFEAFYGGKPEIEPLLRRRGLVGA